MSRVIAQSARPPEADDSFAPQAAGGSLDIDIKPAKRSIVLFGGAWLFASCVLLFITSVVFCAGAPVNAFGILVLVPFLLVVLVVIIAALIWDAHQYQLSGDRIRAARGVFSRISVEARLDHIRNITVVRSLPERILALGTIRMTTAGVGPEIVWRFVVRPDERARRIRESIDAPPGAARIPSLTSESSAPIDPPLSSEPPQSHQPVPGQPAPRTGSLAVIGLAGGIGAGKSTVARAFERFGCHVIDSDARAKAALDRPDVRDQLTQWWGDRVLTPEGRIDRARVAEIIFSNPDERTRLEQLIHPLVREDRARMIQEAQGAGARAVIVDAPLLFEAGIDAECDAVVFVDAPREQRLQRVGQTRNWDQAELDRREAAQLPFEEKKARSQYIIENRAGTGSLDSQVESILADIENPSDSGDLPLPS